MAENTAANTDVSGRWEGLFVHYPDQLTVSVTIQSQGGSLTGSFNISDPPDHPFPDGSLNGSITGTSIILSLAPDDRHGPHTFTGRVEGTNGRLVMLGTIPMSEAFPLAALILFRDTMEVDLGNGPWNGQQLE